jgi:CRISPR-associated endonuclease Csn1
LNSVLTGEISEERKSRDDHRHHAVDAIVVGLTSPRLLQLISTAAGRSEHGIQRLSWSIPDPWDAFRSDVREKAERIVVSHEAQRRLRGAFHEETGYGPAISDGKFTLVVRKSVADLDTGKKIANVRDPGIRRILEENLAVKTQLNRPDGSAPIEKVRINVSASEEKLFFVKDRFGRPIRAHMLGNNHHVEVYRHSQSEELRVEMISALEAATRVRRRGQSAVGSELEGGWTLLWSLCAGDSVRYYGSDGEMQVYFVQKMSSSGRQFEITLRRHWSASKETGKETGELRIRSESKLNLLKPISVDVLGNIKEIDDQTHDRSQHTGSTVSSPQSAHYQE